MGFSTGGVWVTGYDRPMGYGMHFPAHQVSGLILLWDITGYGFSKVWVITGSTVYDERASCDGVTFLLPLLGLNVD